MTMIVKIMTGHDLPDDSPYKTFTLVSEVKSATFHTQEDSEGRRHSYMRAYIADPVKTAEVPGFSEHEVVYDIPPNVNVYVMNGNGKTISSWTAPPVAEGKFTFSASAPIKFVDVSRDTLYGRMEAYCKYRANGFTAIKAALASGFPDPTKVIDALEADPLLISRIEELSAQASTSTT
ncbi:hypothetical protein CcrC1_gp142 [Caulobacter phage C1]|nr:hypothetical protein CcrC1_gp142 [Caulobacter phage C1]UTU08371.1 hypothetical protein CcrC2_gp143 [Caulobacter phage C2]UTU08888.1 hypothetical protein CcrJ4_gp137 [Caulobacter phage J4]UTU09444.1 hypothetical protein CcrBL47_gp158 [Caulobacter phage BL47]UTU10004.1 hypothetical protein CcrRB23_gp142 [Caulobacter phage RB23]WGN97029.1 hypothetical protein [Bertelyvirus sp.]